MKTAKAYKLFYMDKQGRLFPPMVANPNGQPTPVGVWVEAACAVPFDKEEVDAKYPDVPQWQRRYHVHSGGRGTHCRTKGRLSFRPGFHLSSEMDAPQFLKKDGTWPAELVWGLVEYEVTNCYQEECDQRMLYNGKGKKFRRPCHSYGGLNHMPTHGYYRYRTNPKRSTIEWIICDRIKVIEIINN